MTPLKRETRPRGEAAGFPEKSYLSGDDGLQNTQNRAAAQGGSATLGRRPAYLAGKATTRLRFEGPGK
jgi:hypothetical protein